jgi:glycosyltransferase involved in cell wall biosynthesis
MSNISIALCTYNGAKFLFAQLESFLQQTRLPDELVVGDDCSTDETVSILDDFARKAPFPVFLHINEKNLGSTLNFESTISRCTGDLIFLSDQDDVWMPEKLACVEMEFNKNPRAGLVFTNGEIVDENLNPLGHLLWEVTFDESKRKKVQQGKIIEVLLWQNFVTGATAAFRARLRDDFMPIPNDIPDLIHDGWITLVLASQSEVVPLDEVLVKYRQHSHQQLGLDLNYQSRMKKATRQELYDESLASRRKELIRLSTMMQAIKKYPQLQNIGSQTRFHSFLQESVAGLERIIQHYEIRRDLPPNRIKRLLPIAKELFGGRYHSCSKGFLSAAKDLVVK